MLAPPGRRKSCPRFRARVRPGFRNPSWAAEFATGGGLGFALAALRVSLLMVLWVGRLGSGRFGRKKRPDRFQPRVFVESHLASQAPAASASSTGTTVTPRVCTGKFNMLGATCSRETLIGSMAIEPCPWVPLSSLTCPAAGAAGVELLDESNFLGTKEIGRGQRELDQYHDGPDFHVLHEGDVMAFFLKTPIATTVEALPIGVKLPPNPAPKMRPHQRRWPYSANHVRSQSGTENR